MLKKDEEEFEGEELRGEEEGSFDAEVVVVVLVGFFFWVSIVALVPKTASRPGPVSSMLPSQRRREGSAIPRECAHIGSSTTRGAEGQLVGA